MPAILAAVATLRSSADAPAVALSGSIAGDAMADLVEAAQLLDVDVDHLAGAVAFVAAHRLGRLQVAPAVEAVAGENAPDGGPGHADLGCDPMVDTPFLAQGDHLHLNVIRRSVGAGIRPR